MPMFPFIGNSLLENDSHLEALISSMYGRSKEALFSMMMMYRAYSEMFPTCIKTC